MEKNKTGKYLKYAIGEIILVVIGILIALQINNWNEDSKDRQLEKEYIIGLIDNLQTDSIAIGKIKKLSDDQVRRKQKLFSYFDGQVFSNDSIAHYFSIQWGMSVGFNPNTTMLDEMLSTGGIRVIQNPVVRKKIINSYNNYKLFINGSQAYYERNRGELRKMAFKIPNVFNSEVLNNGEIPNIIEALKNDELKNAVLANYAIGVNTELSVLEEDNRELLKLLTGYLTEL